jgi:hypothetical protein
MTDLRAQARKLAQQIVDDIFVNGQGDEAQRLVLTIDSPSKRDLGGWSKECLADRIARLLERQKGQK